MAAVIPEKRALMLRLKEPSKVLGSFPSDKTKVLDAEQFGLTGKIVAVPHRNQSMTVLRNLGIEVRGIEPIRTYYRYPKLRGEFPPMPHQRTTAEFLTIHPKLFCLNVQRTGKTGAVIWASDFMMRERDVKRTLIISTMSCIRTVWRDEIFNIDPSRSVAVLHGSLTKRRRELERDVSYYVINHDGIKVLHRELLAAIKSGRIDLIVLDEAAEFNDSKTLKYAVLKELCDACPRLWCLTGTPMSKGPEAAWALARLVDPRRVPELFGHWQYLTMIKINKFRWVPRKDAKEKVFAALQPAIRFEKKDVLKSLPPVTHTRQEIELTDEQRSMIRELKKQGAMMVDGGRMTVPNAAIMLGKVLQISAGAVRRDDGLPIPVNCKPRLDELERIISGTDAKFIVMANNHAVIDMLQATLQERYGTVCVDGRVTGHRRDEALRRFVNDPACRGLVAHPKTTSHGLELSVADTLVWWSPTHSAEQMAQANERMSSAAQKNPMSIFYLGSTSLEWNVYRNVRGSLDLQQSTMELFREFMDEND